MPTSSPVKSNAANESQKFVSLFTAFLKNNDSVAQRELLDWLPAIFNPAGARQGDAVGSALQQAFALLGAHIYRRAFLDLAVLEPSERAAKADVYLRRIIATIASNWQNALQRFSKERVPEVFDVDGLIVENLAGVSVEYIQPLLKILHNVVVLMRKKTMTAAIIKSHAFHVLLVPPKKMPLKGTAIATFSISFSGYNKPVVCLRASHTNFSRGGFQSPDMQILHELGHFFHRVLLSQDFVSEWESEWRLYETTPYSTKNQREAFAEMFMFCISDYHIFRNSGLYGFFFNKYVAMDRALIGEHPSKSQEWRDHIKGKIGTQSLLDEDVKRGNPNLPVSKEDVPIADRGELDYSLPDPTTDDDDLI